jgi:adenosylmethionine-8-amino-7-oxononanoate aminotransferase
MGDVDDMYWIRKKFVEEGCWVRPFGNIVYLMPPFVISDEELSTLTDTVVKIVGEWSDRKPS